MYLHFNNRQLKCERTRDAGGRGEYYFTWQVYMDGVSAGGDPVTQLHQGFSTGVPIDTGYKLGSGASRHMGSGDPRFTILLPDLPQGTEARVVTDLDLWESDYSSSEVKKAFTNQAAEKLWEIYEAAGQRKDKAIGDFEEWLKGSSDDFLSTLADVYSNVAYVTPYVALAKAAIPLVKMVVSLVKSNSDDFVGSNRTELLYRNERGTYFFRWLVNHGIEKDFKDQRPPFYSDFVFESSNGNHYLITKSFFQVILGVAELRSEADLQPGA